MSTMSREEMWGIMKMSSCSDVRELHALVQLHMCTSEIILLESLQLQ